MIELHLFAIGIEFVDQLTEMKTTTNYIFKNGVKQLQALKAVLKTLYQKLRTRLIEMGHQKTFGRSMLLIEVRLNIIFLQKPITSIDRIEGNRRSFV